MPYTEMIWCKAILFYGLIDKLIIFPRVNPIINKMTL